MGDSVCPFVYWAQTRSTISLKVDLKDVEDPNVELVPERLDFSTVGLGNSGSQQYSFHINFHQCIIPQECKFHVTDRNVQIILAKEEEEWWPHLTREKTKLHWLKVDFDRWRTESDEEVEGRDVMTDYPGVYDRLLKEETAPGQSEQAKKLENFRESYLIMYNLWQLLGYAVILGKLGYRYYLEGESSIFSAYETAGRNMRFAQGLQILEILHPLFGMTRGGVMEPFMQVCGRNLMLFAVLDAEPRLQTKPAVFYLFIIWSLVEIVRYPYYVVRLVRRDIGLLTWLRYTVWIPLYPLGFITEGVLYLRALPYFEETGNFTVTLPNSFNFAFDFPSFIKCYLMFAFLPGMYLVMRHMYAQRSRVIGPRPARKRKVQ